MPFEDIVTCLPVMQEDTCYADLTSSSPQAMEELGRTPSRALFADVAILGPVPVHGARTPLMVSGPGARMLAELYPRTLVYRSSRRMLNDHPPQDVRALGIYPPRDRSRG